MRDGLPSWTTPNDWDDAYANADHIENAGSYVEHWKQASERFREEMLAAGRAELDLAYGDAKREKLDLFLPEGTPKGLFIFVHGGYWLSFDKSAWSHLAAGAIAKGWAVALPSYTLAPEARISTMTQQIGAAILYAATKVEGPVHIAGHSAGGHLVSRMMCADTPLSKEVQARLKHVISISGLHDLRPLLNTRMNEGLQLDLAEARAESAALREPLAGVKLTCWVGADERPEFLRQNQLLANIWTGLGVDTDAVEADHKHHFNVIADLEEADSGLTRLATTEVEA
ncbi:alpha/beta hydrolase [Maritalea mediterranea]|uniref:Alpha/beta hydrolase n=1 Tax=Maritalea mediterranea TaxID=2909667 RepID=A0ABS9E869_9HYPH|nr:alpha/beta hydrolase [Maritalea mediterranea]MCF4097623.1 alpha/beta hydrolase [Maritalea mediterranea]